MSQVLMSVVFEAVKICFISIPNKCTEKLIGLKFSYNQDYDGRTIDTNYKLRSDKLLIIDEDMDVYIVSTHNTIDFI